MLGALIGGVASAYGVKQTNAANERISQKQMDFQERMSNTAYQRSMNDMRKAGLNPMLAYSQGGASSPQGASYQSQDSATAGISTALQLRSAKEQINTQKSQQLLNQTNAGKAAAESELIKSQIPRSRVKNTPYKYAEKGINALTEMISNPSSAKTQSYRQNVKNAGSNAFNRFVNWSLK